MAVPAICQKMLPFSASCVKRPTRSIISRCIHGNTFSRDQQEGAFKSGTTVNQEEVNKFRAMASQCWDPSGDFKALHSFNTLRVPFVREGILQTKKVLKGVAKPLKDFSIVDVGCGGGVLSEPLARLGANVIGIDPAEECITIAKSHLAKDTSLSNLTYKLETAEQHVVENAGRYDAVVLSEVAEHTDNLNLLITSCVNLLKTQGSIFITTINQSLSAWLLAILVAENILRIVPPGTHDYKKLVKPEDLEQLLKSAGCQVHLIHGMMYNPFNNSWHWIKDTSINYAMHAVKTVNK